MKTYILIYSARQFVQRRGVQADRRVKISKFTCDDLDEAKRKAESFLARLPSTVQAKYISLCTEHRWKPKP